VSVPTRSEVYQRFIEHIRLAQEAAATLGHLHADDQGTGKAKLYGFLAISEALKQMHKHAIDVATASGRIIQ